MVDLSVINDDATASLVCEHQPYHVMHKAAFLDLQSLAAKHGVRFVDEATHADARPQSVFDTRPPGSRNAMLQHFVGLEVELDQPAFDPTTAVLMDFRVDQSHRRISCTCSPFSTTTALVESTMFSTQRCHGFLRRCD